MAKIVNQGSTLPAGFPMARNTALLVASSAVSKLLTFICILAITRYLGPELFGKYSFAYALVAMLSFGSELGLSSFTMREVAADPASARLFFPNIMAVRLLLALVTFGVVVALGHVVTHDPAARIAIVLFAVAMMLDALADGLTSFQYAFQQMAFPCAATMARPVVVLGAVLLSARFHLGLGFVVGATVIGAAAAVAVLFLAPSREFWTPRPSLHFGFMYPMLVNALPYAGMALITNMYFRIDILMLSKMKGDAETGLYGAAYRIMESLLFISTAVNTAALPAMSAMLATAPEKVHVMYRTSLRWLVLLGLPMAVGLTVLAQPVMALLGKGFVVAAPALQVLSWALLLIFVNHLTGVVLTAVGWQRLLVKVFAMALAANVALNLILIPPYGRMGAAWVTLLCECALLPALLLLARSHLHLAELLHGFWRPCVAAAGMGCFCWYFAGLSLAAVVPCGAAVYGLLLLACNVLRPDPRTEVI